MEEKEKGPLPRKAAYSSKRRKRTVEPSSSTKGLFYAEDARYLPLSPEGEEEGGRRKPFRFRSYGSKERGIHPLLLKRGDDFYSSKGEKRRKRTQRFKGNISCRLR